MTRLLCLYTYLKTTTTRRYTSGPAWNMQNSQTRRFGMQCTLKAVTKQTKKQERLGGKSDT